MGTEFMEFMNFLNLTPKAREVKTKLINGTTSN